MKQCPKCGNVTKLSRIYCPVCGEKMEFVEEEVTARAVEERKRERMENAHRQLMQWLEIVLLLLVVLWRIGLHAHAKPETSVPPFFFGPAVVRMDDLKPLLIGRDAGLEVDTRLLGVKKVEPASPTYPGPDELKAAAKSLKAAGMKTVVISTRDGKSYKGLLLGKTNAAYTLLVDGRERIVPVGNVLTVNVK